VQQWKSEVDAFIKRHPKLTRYGKCLPFMPRMPFDVGPLTMPVSHQDDLRKLEAITKCEPATSLLVAVGVGGLLVIWVLGLELLMCVAKLPRSAHRRVVSMSLAGGLVGFSSRPWRR
jgi:hypothetical protein